MNEERDHEAKRTTRIDVRYTQDERAAVVLAASRLGVKPSRFVRAAVNDAAKARSDQLGEMERQASSLPDPNVSAAVEQLRRVGVNLNNVVRQRATAVKILKEVHTHTTKGEYSPEFVNAVNESIETLEEKRDVLDLLEPLLDALDDLRATLGDEVTL